MITTTRNDGALPLPSLSSDSRTRAVQLIEDRQYSSAIDLLEVSVQADSSPVTHALLGTAYLLAERYEDARRHLAIAVAAEPTNEGWQAKLTLASSNAVSHVEEDFPKVEPFDREELLAPPSLEPGAIPTAPFEHKAPSFLEKAAGFAAKLTGKVFDAVTGTAAAIGGKVGIADEVWTNWYRKPLVLGFATLQHMRDTLDAKNLVNPYPDDALTAFQSRGLV